MEDRFEFECNISEIDEDYKSTIEEWGACFVWDRKYDENIGVEYNWSIERYDGEENNCSAIYWMEINNEGYMSTDYSRFIHYEVDFKETDWKEKLKEAMINALLEMEGKAYGRN